MSWLAIPLALMMSHNAVLRDTTTHTVYAWLVRTENQLALLELVVACHSGYPEIERRARLLLAQYLTVSPTMYPRMPWIDMLPESWPNRDEIIKYYLAAARKIVALDWPSYYDWLDYRIATRLFVSDLLLSGYSRMAIIKLLDEMAECEIAYKIKARATVRNNQPSP